MLGPFGPLVRVRPVQDSTLAVLVVAALGSDNVEFVALDSQSSLFRRLVVLVHGRSRGASCGRPVRGLISSSRRPIV